MNKDQKYIATRAIFHALMSGRKISQMDCAEFQIEDIRTPISHMKHRYQDTHELHTEWITEIPYQTLLVRAEDREGNPSEQQQLTVTQQ